MSEDGLEDCWQCEGRGTWHRCEGDNCECLEPQFEEEKCDVCRGTGAVKGRRTVI